MSSTSTPIEWTDASWNPVRGCTKVSPGCEHCYAAALAARFADKGLAFEGLAKRDKRGLPQWTNKVRLVHDSLSAPLSWRAPRRIFVNSTSDLFHEAVPDGYVAAVFGVMALAGHHTFQVLTKRPERMRALLGGLDLDACLASLASLADETGYIGPSSKRSSSIAEQMRRQGRDPSIAAWPLPHVWLGTSIEHDDTLGRWRHLAATPAAVRFLSCEPLLGELDLGPEVPLEKGSRWASCLCAKIDLADAPCIVCETRGPLEAERHVDWVIVGGESGPRARPMDPAWARSIVESCAAAKVPVFVKQMGAWEKTDVVFHGFSQWVNKASSWLGGARRKVVLLDAKGRICTSGAEMERAQAEGAFPCTAYLRRKGQDKGSKMADWPAELRVRQMPEAP